jgi:hypothetical protein
MRSPFFFQPLHLFDCGCIFSADGRGKRPWRIRPGEMSPLAIYPAREPRLQLPRSGVSAAFTHTPKTKEAKYTAAWITRSGSGRRQMHLAPTISDIQTIPFSSKALEMACR